MCLCGVCVCVCVRWRTCCSPNSTSSARFTFQFNSSSPTFMRLSSAIARSRVSRSFRSTFLKASYRQSSSQLECVITRLRYYCARCTNLRGMIFVDFCSHKLFSGWRNGRAFARDPKGGAFESRPVRFQTTALANVTLAQFILNGLRTVIFSMTASCTEMRQLQDCCLRGPYSAYWTQISHQNRPQRSSTIHDLDHEL